MFAGQIRPKFLVHRCESVVLSFVEGYWLWSIRFYDFGPIRVLAILELIEPENITKQKPEKSNNIKLTAQTNFQKQQNASFMQINFVNKLEEVRQQVPVFLFDWFNHHKRWNSRQNMVENAIVSEWR